jgi:biopolymer transport protein ExbB
MKTKTRIPFKQLLLCLLTATVLTGQANAWWNKEWTIRKKITVDTGGKEAGISGAIGTTVVLLRLHDGNFQFDGAKDDGSDIRFVSGDDKTPLPYHIERYDAVLNEAFVWVKVPDVKPGAQTGFWLYYGSASDKAVKVEDAKGTYDADTVLVYHFGEKNAPAIDASGKGNVAQNAGVSMDSIIGGGLRLSGQSAITIPASESLAWTPSGAVTWSAWVKAAALAPNAVLFSRRENGNAFLIGLDNGIPYVEVKSAAGTQRSSTGSPVEAGGWHHLAVVADGSQITLYLDGESYGALGAALPALNSPSLLGGDVPEGSAEGTAVAGGFAGELDELEISKTARPAGFIKLAALSQGTGDKAAKLLTYANDESSGGGGDSELNKQLSLIVDISKNLTFDGWIVIGLCAILATIGMGVAVMKFAYLNRIEKATKAFLRQWKELAANLHVLDHGDETSISSMGGQASAKVQKAMRQSPLYHIYQIGSAEIQDRLASGGENFKGLSGRSMQSIRATLDGGMVRQVQKLNSSLVFLTIGIAGGPYLGLLGTVIGVMITFAVIAKSGAVEVNSIAPGIAGALLATVAGLAVAIPALFAYSYISSRIKDAVSEMQIFIDEFVAKIAEFYSWPSD